MTNVIDLIDVALLRIAAPATPTNELAEWVAPIKAACKKFSIDTVREVACFLAQSSHESGGFRVLSENLRYTKASRLKQIWPKRFPTEAAAAPYVNNPQKLANKVYANRMGNGDEASGDGYKFRGGGLFQLTGRENYTRFAKSVGKTVDEAGEYVRTKEGAAMSAGWYFDDRNLDALAATPGVEDETKAINGGYIGIEERRAHFNAIVGELIRRGA